MPGEAEVLLEVWGNNWEGLGEVQQQADAIMSALEQTRSETLGLLRSLD
jgi:hypothetical protein